jgi:hypothetical protein
MSTMSTKRTRNSCPNLYNNFAKPFSTVCPVSISSQISGPRPPNFLQADSKLAGDRTSLGKTFHGKFPEIFLEILFWKFFYENAERSVAFGEWIIT